METYNLFFNHHLHLLQSIIFLTSSLLETSPIASKTCLSSAGEMKPSPSPSKTLKTSKISSSGFLLYLLNSIMRQSEKICYGKWSLVRGVEGGRKSGCDRQYWKLKKTFTSKTQSGRLKKLDYFLNLRFICNEGAIADRKRQELVY